MTYYNNIEQVYEYLIIIIEGIIILNTKIELHTKFRLHMV